MVTDDNTAYNNVTYGTGTRHVIEKHIPVKVGSGEYEPKPQSIIECCVHCGSIAIKKHGKQLVVFKGIKVKTATRHSQRIMV